MRDEDKSKEQLLQELRSLRGELIRLKGKPGHGATAEALHADDDAQSAEGPDDSSDLVWSEENFDIPLIDDDEGFTESPRLLCITGDKGHKGGAAGSNDVTETGSYDLTWISMGSFGKLLNAVPMPILLCDVSGRILFENHAFTIISSAHFSLCGDSIYSLFHPEEEAEKAGKLVERVLRMRMPQEREGVIEVNGKAIWTRIHLRSIRFGGERSVLALVEDLSTEKRELTLNEKYRKLVHTFPIGIAEFALEGKVSRDLSEEDLVDSIMNSRVVGGNRRFARLSGYDDVKALEGLRLRTLLPSTQADLARYRMWGRGGFSLHSFETKEKFDTDTVRYFETTLVGNVHDNVLDQFWVMKQDITEQKRIQEDLLQKIATIDQLYEHIVQIGKAKAIAEHTATVAHELRQPLAIIGGFARRISRDCESCPSNADGSKHRLFDVIITEVERLEKILGGLIDFSKRDDVAVRRVNPNEIVEYILRINQERMMEKNLCLDLGIGSEVGEIPLDPDGFSQVVRNLVANAIEASPPGETLSVETGVAIPSVKALQTGQLASEAYYELKIRNRGKPVSREHLQKVFNPFFTTKDSGTGLGLTLSKKIVEDHGGSISVKSDVAGTVLTVWLPTG
ncbi:MAG: ATP-binding protein [Desulfomonilaceae bacterium]|nr:ATP-binding protein [Desulfomonilaceae bacterium]